MYNGEIHILCFETTTKQLGGISRADPCAEFIRIPVAVLLKTWTTQSYANTGKWSLIGIDTGQCFAPALGCTVYVLAIHRHVLLDRNIPRVTQDCLAAAREHDSPTVGLIGRMKCVIRSDDVQRQ